MQLPEGWRLTPRVPAKRCPTCGEETGEKPGVLTTPSGECLPLIGNASAAQEREMVKRIIESHT